MEAEDLLHEGFIKIFTKIDQFKKTGPFEAWIRRLMVNTILEAFRKKKKMNLVDEINLPANLSDDDDEAAADETPDMARITALINELPERYRMVFNLYVTEGYTHEQIAEEMEISVGTSKSNLSRARQWLKNRILNRVTDKHESLW
jgi:RNA polymerase sigma-70 factor (ECF subfamily)